MNSIKIFMAGLLSGAAIVFISMLASINVMLPYLSNTESLQNKEPLPVEPSKRNNADAIQNESASMANWSDYGMKISGIFFTKDEVELINDELGRELIELQSRRHGNVDDKVDSKAEKGDMEEYEPPSNINHNSPSQDLENKVKAEGEAKAPSPREIEMTKKIASTITLIKSIYDEKMSITESSDGKLNAVELKEKIKSKFKEIPMEFTYNYPAENEKKQIIVFSDPTCAFCKRLHQAIRELNSNGVTVRYILFPRAGTDSVVGKQIGTLACINNPLNAIEQWFTVGNSPDKNYLCDDLSGIYFNWAMGFYFGVLDVGTPIIISNDGNRVIGFSGVSSLLKSIGMNDSESR